ncbi:UPF0223 family protein [Virgibacillus pantothenticus]|nr:UPF0223 family protein [Virgibacillus pantothenticus]MEB5466997.1 UPF0223 family protein [Virgibacillus pantothenticus]
MHYVVAKRALAPLFLANIYPFHERKSHSSFNKNHANDNGENCLHLPRFLLTLKSIDTYERANGGNEMSYHYPIDDTWTKEEVIQVVQFFSLIEQAYEKKVEKDILLAAYRGFKQVVPSKSEEKKLFATFKQGSGYSSFHVIKQAKETEERFIMMDKTKGKKLK